MQTDLTKGSVTGSMLKFAWPLILGNLLQQLYNVADAFIVGQFVSSDALAAVGSSFTLMVFLTSIILGLCMGSGTLFSMLYGAKEEDRLKTSFFVSFIFIGAISVVINILVIAFTNPLLSLLQIPDGVWTLTKDYISIIFYGILFTFVYNYFAFLLRGIGNSVIPLLFLALAALLNIVLDLLFVVRFGMGVSGAAIATVIAQAVSGISIAIFSYVRIPELQLQKKHFCFETELFKSIIQYSLLTSVQQSVMNFGILLIQGLVNSFGIPVMAAFAAAVKIDAFAYIPVQDFGNAFSTFIAQNHGAGKRERIKGGVRSALKISVLFCIVLSILVVLFANQLMMVFVKSEEVEIIAIGVQYLRIEGACFVGIGCLFLLYGYYRGIGKPGMSVVLTVLSLGTRVLLAYSLAPVIGLVSIWLAIPIGWLIADCFGFFYYFWLGRKAVHL